MHRIATIGAVAIVAGALLSGIAPAGARPAPPNDAGTDPLGHAGRWITDPTGRVVIVHGVNVPTKTLPAYPGAIAFGDDDAALLASVGLDAVRLTVERYAVEPKAGQFDDAYLGHIADTVGMLARHGIRTLIDFHQDEYGPVFGDNGFPDWMTVTDGLPNVTQVGFPAQYFLNPALLRAFDHFWANDPGPDGRPLQDDDATLLAHVASALRDLPGMLGYELINEPAPGSQYPPCLVPQLGCPQFDRTVVSAYYRRVAAAVRTADPTHLIWYEPLQSFNQGVPTSVVPPPGPLVGFAFHDYPLCSAGLVATGTHTESSCAAVDAAEDGTVVANALAHVTRTGDALLETEFGNTADPTTLDGQLGRFDQAMIPWMFWAYTRLIDPFDNTGRLQPATPANINTALVKVLARPYPQLVAGTPAAWSFDPATGAFTFSFSRRRPTGRGSFGPGSETDISLPSVAYPHGYTARVAGATVVSAPGDSELRIRAAKAPAPITVTVTPAAQ